MLAYIHAMPLARCVGHANNKDLQNDVPYSCAKPMHQFHAKNMSHAPDKFRTPEEQFLENSCLFKVIRSASLFQLPSLLNACDAVATLIFGSDSKVAPNTGGPGLRSLE